MIGRTNTTGRVTTAFAAALAIAALASPTAFAGTRGPGAVPESTATQMERHYQHEDAIYQEEGSRVGAAVPGSTAAQMERHFQHEDAVYQRSGSLPNGQRTVTVTVSGGFSWGSFGIGIGAGIGALLILGVLAMRLGKMRQVVSA
jgi:hypothetical protein